MSRRAARSRTPPPRVAPPTVAIRATSVRVWAAVIVAAGCLAYSNSLDNPLVLDDQRAVLTNTQIRTLWPLTVPLSPPVETPVARRPLVNLSFALNYAAGGVDPAGYHLGNLAVVLMSALVFFGVVRRTLMLDSLSSTFGIHATSIAGVCALVWSIHPLQTEIVNYVSQRTTALMGLFFLLTAYCSIRALAARSNRWRVAAVVSCAAGMTCKESMVTAPVAVLLFDRVFVFASLREAFRERGTFYAALAGTWTVLAVLMASGGRTTVGFDAGVSAWTYLLNQSAVIVDYLRLVFWPRALVIDYGLPQPLAPGEVLMPTAVIAALATATLVALRYKPAAGFLGAVAFLTLAPTSSIVPIATEVGAERRMFLPLAALVVLVVCAAFLGGRAAVPRIARRLTTAPDAMASVASRWLAFGAVAVVVVLLVAGTLIRNAEYHSAEVLARTTVERKPHGRAYYALGNALFEEGKREEAIRYFRRSARDFPAAHFPLGSELLADGRLDDGIGELRKFIELMPNHMAAGGARQMIATALGAQGRMSEAIAELKIAIGIEPRDPRLNGLLGEFLLRNNQLPEAVHYLGRAVTLQPSARLFDLLGTAYALQGQLQEALPRFRMAAQIDPNHPTARANVERAEQLLAHSVATR